MALGWRSPWDKDRPNIPQQRFLTAAFRPTKGIAVTHLIGGRGVAKTTSMMLALVESAMRVNPGLLHMWTEPTVDDCTKVFLSEWEQYVPPDWYEINKSTRIIYLKNEFANPTPIMYRGRDVGNQNREHGRGPNLAALFFDELRQDPTDKEWKASIPMVRHPRSKHLMICTGSTPIMNWYHKVVKAGVKAGHAVEIHGTSWDNPHYLEAAIEVGLANCDKQWARQEHYGEWIQLSGRAWDNALVTDDPEVSKYDWPAGNMHPHQYDPSLPYTVSVDFGVRSSWLVWQTVPASRMPRAPLVDVVVAEYTPNFGDTAQIARDIEFDLGKKPNKVICGADANTSYDWQKDKSPRYLLHHIGWGCPIKRITGKWSSKTLQYKATKKCFEDYYGNRTICVSKNLKTKYGNDRGIIEVINNDTWPDKERPGEFLPKDKSTGPGYEDTRDAMEYFVINTHPPIGIDEIPRQKNA